tara:strand:+ start:170 stop:667 length:498 start_codon:yes stop_codon:yes gene_type:complete
MRYHPRFDSNAWVWPTGPIAEEENKGNVISLGHADKLPVVIFDKGYTRDTADPWFIIYADNRGGISAATWVIDDADNGIYAFYNTRLVDRYDGSTPLEALMNPLEGTPFSPREETMASLWNTLTTVVSPSYESMNDLKNQIKGATITYFASHPIPQSINKLHIGG